LSKTLTLKKKPVPAPAPEAVKKAAPRPAKKAAAQAKRPPAPVVPKSDIEAFYAPCPRGLAGVLADELREMGAAKVEPQEAGVAFEGKMVLAYRANLESRIASRILWRVAQFDYANEMDIFEGAKRLAWHRYFGISQTFKVETNAHRAPVKSLDFVTLKVKDAIADTFRAAIGKRPNVETRAPDHRIHVFLDARKCALYVDTSGESLFKRGRRDHVGEAPLKKNLAAGILRLAGWKPGAALLDPMCGSGTFLVEAAEMAQGIAAGHARRFAFEKLNGFDSLAWSRMKDEARMKERPASMLPIFGSELYGRTLDLARENLVDAGMASAVQLKQANLLDLSAPAANGIIVTNPPYGVRLGEKEQLAQFYPKLGDLLKRKFAGWNAHIFSGDPEIANLIGLKASKRTVLFNGAIECRLYEYRMVAGTNRE
jgi:putative N6-adenine-specific DNA methylase